jgi:hypothetical protein
MEIEFIVKGLALLVAIGLLLSTIDFSYLLAKLSVKDDEKLDDKVVVNVNTDKSDNFLKTLELWYLLKKQCEKAELNTASKKLDEVFPLLNDNMEEI